MGVSALLIVFVVPGVNTWVKQGCVGLSRAVRVARGTKKKPDPARPAGWSTGFGLPVFSGARSHLYSQGFGRLISGVWALGRRGEVIALANMSLCAASKKYTLGAGHQGSAWWTLHLVA